MKVGGIRAGGVPRPDKGRRGTQCGRSVAAEEEEAEVGVAVAGEVGTRIGEGGVVLRACVHNNDCLFSFFFSCCCTHVCSGVGAGGVRATRKVKSVYY